MLRSRLHLLAFLLALTAAPAWAHGVRGPELRPPTRVDAAGAIPSPAETGRLSDAARQVERHLRRAPSARSGAGLAALTGALIAAGGLTGLGWFWRRDRRMAVAAATAGLVLGFVVESTPHLVHHAFDRDRGAGCEVLQTVERSQAARGAVDVAPPPAPADPIDIPPSTVLTALPAPAPCGRAPPA